MASSHSLEEAHGGGGGMYRRALSSGFVDVVIDNDNDNDNNAAPPIYHAYDKYAKPANANSPWRRCPFRVRVVAFGVSVFALIVLLGAYAVSFTSAHEAHLFLEWLRVHPSVKRDAWRTLADGRRVHNVFEHEHPLESYDEWYALMRDVSKLRHARVPDVSTAEFARGYYEFQYTPTEDTDQDQRTFNATLDGVEFNLRHSVAVTEDVVCEHFLHVGALRNALYIRDADVFWYNVRVAEASEYAKETAEQQRARHCRAARSIAESTTRAMYELPAHLELEYTTRDVAPKLRRTKVTDARRIACVLHACSMAGVYTQRLLSPSPAV